MGTLKDKKKDSALFEIVVKCGGEQSIAYHCNVHQQTVRRWIETGIPQKYWIKLEEISKGALSYKHIEAVHEFSDGITLE